MSSEVDDLNMAVEEMATTLTQIYHEVSVQTAKVQETLEKIQEHSKIIQAWNRMLIQGAVSVAERDRSLPSSQ